jgi:hypothetical protein
MLLIDRFPTVTAADYLIQHASRERPSARVPASVWDALLSHLHDPADAGRLAHSADGRLLYRYAIPLYRYAADAGHEDAAWGLASLLAQRGDLGELRVQADAGNENAAVQLAGDNGAGIQLADLLRNTETWPGPSRLYAPKPTSATETSDN